MKEDKEFTAISSSDDIVASTYMSRYSDAGLDTAVEIEPFEEMTFEESHEKIRNFLNQEFIAENRTGFELVYDHKKRRSTFNLLMDEEDSRHSANETLSNFIDVNAGSRGSRRIDIFKNVSEDSYVTGGNIRFSNDYWHALKMNPSEYEEDPLISLFKQLSDNGNKKVSTVLQLTAVPVEDERLRKRYAIPNILPYTRKNFANDLENFKSKIGNDSKESGLYEFSKGLTYLSLIFPYLTLELMWRMFSNTKNDFRMTKEAVEKGGKYTGIGFRHLVRRDSLKVEGIESGSDGNIKSNIGEAISKVSEKGEEDGGFVVNMRVLFVGDDKEEVETVAENVSRDLRVEHSTSESDASVQQRLVVEPVKNRDQLKQLIIDMSKRKTGVNVQNKIRSPYRWRTMHKQRKAPMVMSRSEIASIYHLPSEDVIDSSINWGEKSISGGRIPDY